ncbi:MAG: hypothetical protein K8U57_27885, partial [Planctomycetes bacterium]|nr:hypothetical protein [Planctomycetota bacterium]
MTTAGPNLPGTAGTLSAGGASLNWTNPNNIKTADTVYATCAPDAASTIYTYLLQATNFGFAIPAGATITGVTVTYRGKVSNDAVTGNLRLRDIYLLKAGTQAGTNQTNSANLTTTDTTYTRGGSSSLWGTTLT